MTKIHVPLDCPVCGCRDVTHGSTPHGIAIFCMECECYVWPRVADSLNECFQTPETAKRKD